MRYIRESSFVKYGYCTVPEGETREERFMTSDRHDAHNRPARPPDTLIVPGDSGQRVDCRMLV